MTIDEIYERPLILYGGTTFRYLKSRLNNSNNSKGKSSGYRLYYFVDRATEIVTILGFYPKTGVYGRSDLTDQEEKDLIKEFENERNSDKLVYHDVIREFANIQQ